MAKAIKRTHRPIGRDTVVIATAPRGVSRRAISLSHAPTLPLADLLFSGGSLSDVEDNRLWHPEVLPTPSRNLFGRPARVVVPGSPTVPSRARRWKDTLPWSTVYRSPAVSVVCIRRNQRRQVLAAKGKFGRFYLGKRRLTAHSRIHC